MVPMTSLLRAAKNRAKEFRARILSLDLMKSPPGPQSAEDLEASKEFSVVLPIHDSPDVTMRCIESLNRYAGHAEIILVDDGSRKPETKALLQKSAADRNWLLIAHDKPQRHSRACEHGCRHASRRYLCLLNSDTVITAQVWKEIKKCFEADPRIAVVGPASNHDTFQLASRRACYCGDFWTNNEIYSFAARFVAGQPPASWTAVPGINGFAFFIRKTTWDELGGFHPELPDYGNETELCVRIVKRGLIVAFTRNAYIHHFGSQSIGRTMTEQQMGAAQIRAQNFIDALHAGRAGE